MPTSRSTRSRPLMASTADVHRMKARVSLGTTLMRPRARRYAGERLSPSEGRATRQPRRSRVSHLAMQKSLPPRAAILDLLGKEDRAFHAKEIASLLGLGDRSYEALVRQLEDLVFQGVLAARDGHKFKLSRTTAAVRTSGDEREGYVSIHPRGFGFVASAAAPADDVYV